MKLQSFTPSECVCVCTQPQWEVYSGLTDLLLLFFFRQSFHEEAGSQQNQ